MATKFKFEMESDGLTEVQSHAFAAFVNSLKEESKRPLGVATERLEKAVEAMDKPKRRRKAVKQEAPKQEAPEPKQEAPEQEAPEQEVAHTHTIKAEEQASKYTIQDVRAKLTPLVKTNRDAIIAKLKELDAKSVSLLAPKHYTEMYEFLDTLA